MFTLQDRIETGCIPVSNGLPDTGIWYFQGYIFNFDENSSYTVRFREKKWFTRLDAINIIYWLLVASDNPEEEVFQPLGKYTWEELEDRIETNNYPIEYADRISVGNGFL